MNYFHYIYQAMKLTKYIPAVFTFFIIIGILFGYYLEPNPILIVFFLLLLLLGLYASYYFTNTSFSKSLHFSIISYLLFFVIGISAVIFQNQKNNKNHYTHFINGENKMVLVVNKKLKSTNYYDKYFANISQLDSNKTIGTILLNIKKDSLINNQANVGDKIYVQTQLKEINKPLNPYQFDYRKYLEKQQIHHQITTHKTAYYLLKRNNTLNSVLHNFRNKINNSLKKHSIKNDELAIINAILLGQRQDISKGLLESYAGAGAIHILAVSGLHIGILLMLLSYIFKPIERIKNGKTIKVIVIIIFLWMYAFLAGLSPSVIRAVTMFTAISIGLYSNKRTSTLHSLFISMFVLLLIHPLYIFSVGFQLSYLAVFSIVYFYPLFIKFYNPQFWLFKKVWQLFAISVSAQLGILPLSLYYFHQFPSLFFISSMVIIPFLGIILGFGILVIILSLLDILPLSIAKLFSWIIYQMNNFIAFIAKQEAFLFKNIGFSMLLLVASYFIIIGVFKLWNKPSFKRIGFILLSIILFQVVLLYEKYHRENSNEFIIFNKYKQRVFLDRKGINTTFYHDLDSLSFANSYVVNNYKIGTGIVKVSQKPIKNIYNIKNKSLLIIDSLGVYNIPNFKTDYIVLQQSPKINMERFIKKLQPKLVIMDNSNYKSSIKRWEKTCIENNTPIYNITKKGAFILAY